MSSSIDLFRCSVNFWDKLSVKTTKSVVFIDSVCAECLHWHGGSLLLFNAGATDVKEFSSFEVFVALRVPICCVLSGERLL